MAHHMLYTALQEHPCYNGYLWAPFDTLLNVPRLQLFDQRKFWYHSPFGRYVPNRALGPSAIRNASFHAPPANISPDPANMTTPWKGWGEEWWYVKQTSASTASQPAHSLLSHIIRNLQVGVRSQFPLALSNVNPLFFLTRAPSTGLLMSDYPFACQLLSRCPRRNAIASLHSRGNAIASSAARPIRCTYLDGTALPSCPPSRFS
jgi:hypothetical protein